MTTFKNALASFSIVAMAFALFSGCANYQLGTTLPPHLRTISVGTFKNLSGEPQIETTITSEVIKQFQIDGQLKIKNAEEADIILIGKITKYELKKVVADRNNPKRTLLYESPITVEITAKERATGKEITSETLSGSSTFNVTGDLISARRNALPDVAKDVAKKVVDAVVSAW